MLPETQDTRTNQARAFLNDVVVKRTRMEVFIMNICRIDIGCTVEIKIVVIFVASLW